MRTEVKDFMRMCERLISLAMQSHELSEDECNAIAYYAQELHKTLILSVPNTISSAIRRSLQADSTD